MASITTRSGKGSPLTHAEVDANFTNLNTDKLESSTAAATYAPKASPTFTGTVSGPSYTVTGSTVPTNGVYLPAANTVGVATNGTGRLFIDASGRVGIGTTPSQLLHVSGSGAAYARIDGGSTSTVGILFNNGDGAIYYDNNADYLRFDALGGEKLRITSTGTVNIKGAGTAGSTQAVSFNGSAPVNSLVLTSGGLVGVGTSVPAAILSTKPSASSTTAATTFTGDGLFIDCANTTDGSGNYGGAISWSRSGSSATRAAAIANVQTSGDADIQGLAFLTHNSSTSTNPLIEAMRITGAGLVGIGTSTPGSYTPGNLVVEAATTAGITISDSTGGGTASIAFSATPSFQNRAKINCTMSSQSLEFFTATAERARIDSSGRLLVGTSTARSNFFNSTNSAANQIEGTSNDGAALAIIQNFNGASNGAVLILAKSNGSSVGSNTIIANTNIVGQLSFQGNDGTEFTEAASIRAEVDGTPGTNDMPGRLVFSVTADGASSPTEAMRIKNSRILNFANTPTYADNAAAKTGGLVDGDVYRKSDGTLMIVYT